MPTSPQAQSNLFGLPSGTACWCIQNSIYQFVHRRYVWDMIQPFLQIPFLHEPLVISSNWKSCRDLFLVDLAGAASSSLSHCSGSFLTFGPFFTAFPLFATPEVAPGSCPAVVSRSSPYLPIKIKILNIFLSFPRETGPK